MPFLPYFILLFLFVFKVKKGEGEVKRVAFEYLIEHTLDKKTKRERETLLFKHLLIKE